MKSLKSFLNENPILMQAYVKFIMSAVTMKVSLINMVMRHVIKIQNLDPDVTPMFYLQESLDKAFSQSSTKDYEVGFDPLEWLNKKRQDVNSKLNGPELTKESFNKLTDISKWPNYTSEVKEEKPLLAQSKLLDKTKNSNRRSSKKSKLIKKQ